jgi:F0F1-type ATP synthase assembly protein I
MAEHQSSVSAPPRRHLWPWIVLAFVVLGFALAILSVKQEAQRVREQRQFQMDPGTNAR